MRTMGVFLLWGSWRDCLYFIIALFVGAFSGPEDGLYYVLDRKPMPDSLPWLDSNPTIYVSSKAGVLGSIAFWLGMLAVLYFVLYIWKKEKHMSG
jgi:hypothetical protein